MFIATSLDRGRARSFAQNAKCLVILKIPKGCQNALNISRLSEYSSEEEVLIPPYSPLRVVSCSGQSVTVDVLDGMSTLTSERSTG